MLTAQYESFIRAALARSDMVTLMLVASCALPNCARVNALVRGLAAHYNVPLADYAALAETAAQLTEGLELGAVRAELYTDPGKGGGHMWHPLWPVHTLIGEAIGECLHSGWRASCGEEAAEVGTGAALVSEEQLLQAAACSPPASFYSARAQSPGWLSEHWLLAEDSPGKLGWLSSTAGSSISFPVSFHSGGSGRLTVIFLRSYEGMGRVSLQLLGLDGAALPAARPQALTLSGTNPDPSVRASQAHSWSCSAAEEWPALVLGRSYSLVLTLLPFSQSREKFKVLHLETC